MCPANGHLQWKFVPWCISTDMVARLHGRQLGNGEIALASKTEPILARTDCYEAISSHSLGFFRTWLLPFLLLCHITHYKVI